MGLWMVIRVKRNGNKLAGRIIADSVRKDAASTKR